MGLSNLGRTIVTATHWIHHIYWCFWNQFLFCGRIFKQQNLGKRTPKAQQKWQKTKVNKQLNQVVQFAESVTNYRQYYLCVASAMKSLP